MSDLFRSGHYKENPDGSKRLDYGPMGWKDKDNLTEEIIKNSLGSHYTMPLVGIALMGLSMVDKYALDEILLFCFREGLTVSKDTIMMLYAGFSAAPLVIGGLALYKGTMNFVNNKIFK